MHSRISVAERSNGVEDLGEEEEQRLMVNGDGEEAGVVAEMGNVDDTTSSDGGWGNALALLGKRPTLMSRMSHLSAISTETTEGNSSEGHTFSVDSEEMAPKLPHGVEFADLEDDIFPFGREKPGTGVHDPSFATYFGSRSSDMVSSKGKEREWLRADDFDVLHEEYSPSNSQASARSNAKRQSPHVSFQSQPEMPSAEQDRTRFEAAIRARHRTAHFKPAVISTGESSSRRAAVGSVQGQRGSSSTDAKAQQSPRQSLHHQRHGQLGPSRRGSMKRAHSNKMSWDLALLSPAPHNDMVEENFRDKHAKAMGSRSPASSPLDFNIIEHAFTAAIDVDNAGLVGVTSLNVDGASQHGATYQPQPPSPSGLSTSSRSSGDSRHRFRSYNGPSETENPSSHANLFYLAFGNGGSSSRQSLTGQTVQKKRQRAEDDRVERDQLAVDKVQREERRKQPRDNKFERSVEDDSNTGSQTESITESSAESLSGNEDKNEDWMRQVTLEVEVARAEEKRRKRREAKEKRKTSSTPSPEPIIPAAVIMPITGRTILTRDGRPISNDPKDPVVLEAQRDEPDMRASSKTIKQKRSVKSAGSQSSDQTPRIKNEGSTLRPHGSFTTARHPNMTLHADAIRAKALISDDRFDTINFDQLQAAADAGDQIAEAHLRQRRRRDRFGEESGKVVIPADLPENAPPLRRRNTVATAGSRRRSSAESVVAESRKPNAPPMQSIPEDATSHPQLTQAERKVSQDIRNQVVQAESRRSSGSTLSSGRLSTISLGSAVEALLDTVGDRDKPIELPIKLSSRRQRTRSSEPADAETLREREAKSAPASPYDSSRQRSPFISNTMLSSGQDFFNVPAFPPVTSPISPHANLRSTSPSRKGSGQSQAQTDITLISPAREPELFMDVARLTSMQMEKDRAVKRAEDARSKGLATESSSTRQARIANARRLRIDGANADLANGESDVKDGKIDSEIASAMASFSISYEPKRRPSVDNGSHDPLHDADREQKRAERQRKKRMRRQLEHERVIRETPMEEYSNPMDTYLGKLSLGEAKADPMPQLTESNDEDEYTAEGKATGNDTNDIPTTKSMPSGEG